MAQMTLLAMVQNILSAMDSDEVNSITDTVEAMQVATIVKETYEDLVSTLEIPERKVLFHLESEANTDRANYLSVPADITDVYWIKYNGVDVTYLEPDVFINMVLREPGTQTVKDPFQDLEYQIINDRDPRYYTTFDDAHLVFDSFNVNAESTLQGVNTMCYGAKVATLELDDNAIPWLDHNFFPTLLAEAKTSCFVNLKQVSNSKEEVRARRGLVRIQNELSKVKRSPTDRLPNYGRRR